MIAAGHHRARAVEGAFGFTNGGNQQVAVLFEILDGDSRGQRITWHGYFTEKTEERTIQSLIYAGWDGDSVTLEGLGTTEVSIDIAHEVSTSDGKTYAKVNWVNRPGGSLAMKQRMDDAQRASFVGKLRGKAAGVKQRMKAKGETVVPLRESGDDSFNYGNNDMPPGLD